MNLADKLELAWRDLAFVSTLSSLPALKLPAPNGCSPSLLWTARYCQLLAKFCQSSAHHRMGADAVFRNLPENRCARVGFSPSLYPRRTA
jgi:hypothetical protein